MRNFIKMNGIKIFFQILFLSMFTASFGQLTGGGNQGKAPTKAVAASSGDSYKAVYIGLAAPGLDFQDESFVSSGFAFGTAVYNSLSDLGNGLTIGVYMV